MNLEWRKKFRSSIYLFVILSVRLSYYRGLSQGQKWERRKEIKGVGKEVGSRVRVGKEEVEVRLGCGRRVGRGGFFVFLGIFLFIYNGGFGCRRQGIDGRGEVQWESIYVNISFFLFLDVLNIELKFVFFVFCGISVFCFELSEMVVFLLGIEVWVIRWFFGFCLVVGFRLRGVGGYYRFGTFRG